jgi:uncharacterized membrane protein
MIRIALIVTYLIGMVVAIVLMDSDGDGWWGTIWMAVSVLLGAGTGEFRFALLSFLAIPIAIPFGLPADTQADPVFPVWVYAASFASFFSVLTLLAALVRRIVDARLQRRRTLRDSGIA